jgi:hypothetical protein
MSNIVTAPSGEGYELPVIDVTNPAFAIDPAAVEASVATFVREDAAQARVPAILMRCMMAIFLRRSRLARSLRKATAFLPGLDTYLFKLGPANLGPWASASDRRVAASMPAMSMRLRLVHMANLLADGVAPKLAHDARRPLRFVTIAGGPAADCFNAIILLRQRAPNLLAGRRLMIDVLDLDDVGPAFGARALAALCANGPLRGLAVEHRHVRYNWNDTIVLRDLLDQVGDAIVAVSSEGGLFEYGDEASIRANFDVLRDHGPSDMIVVGSVTRDDGAMPIVKRTSTVPTRPRALAAFLELARGWRLDALEDSPLSRDVRLVREL